MCFSFFILSKASVDLDTEMIEAYKQQSDRFVRLSAIISFIHHMVVLSFILYCLMNDEVFNNLVIGRFGLQHWNDKKFILNKYLDLRKHQLVYYIFAAITGLGSLGLSATLYFGARSLKWSERRRINSNLCSYFMIIILIANTIWDKLGSRTYVRK